MIEKRQCRADQPNKQGKGYFVEEERVSQLLQRDLNVSVHKLSY